MIYLKLFLSFLQIGLFSFGGGYAAMPLIQEQVVTQHGWLTMTEFTDLITISQMTPGPIAINAATFVGSKIAGVPGSVAATCGCILPSCIIVTLIAWFYLRYKKMKMFQSVLESLRPAVVALIASAGIAILHSTFNVSATLVLLPFGKALEKLACLTIRFLPIIFLFLFNLTIVIQSLQPGKGLHFGQVINRITKYVILLLIKSISRPIMPGLFELRQI